MVLQLLEAGMMLLKLNHRHLVREMMIGKVKESGGFFDPQIFVFVGSRTSKCFYYLPRRNT